MHIWRENSRSSTTELMAVCSILHQVIKARFENWNQGREFFKDFSKINFFQKSKIEIKEENQRFFPRQSYITQRWNNKVTLDCSIAISNKLNLMLVINIFKYLKRAMNFNYFCFKNETFKMTLKIRSCYFLVWLSNCFENKNWLLRFRCILLFPSKSCTGRHSAGASGAKKFPHLSV